MLALCAEICFSSDDSPIRITHGRYTSSSASSEYEDAELVHTEVRRASHWSCARHKPVSMHELPAGHRACEADLCALYASTTQHVWRA